jgi:hypothetical protein
MFDKKAFFLRTEQFASLVQSFHLTIPVSALFITHVADNNGLSLGDRRQSAYGRYVGYGLELSH